MSLQDEANTVQAVLQTEHSPPRIRISRRLAVIYEKVKAVLERSGWVALLQTVSRWLLGLSLILTLSVFSYIALYSWVMPTEVELAVKILILSCQLRLFIGFRFMKKTSTSSSATARTEPGPAVIPT